MHVVIDIPEKEWTRWIIDGEMNANVLSDSLNNGTPLPKGHGRLKDVDWIDDNCENHYSDKDGSWCYTWKDIDNAPTIIEADRTEGSGEK